MSAPPEPPPPPPPASTMADDVSPTIAAPSPPSAPLSTSPAPAPTLNVRDALAYLEEVKIQFHDRPHVYNRFLDIMKDFKSHHIDTPGVIDRVSSLFENRISLIQGFNTFLPPGYRIECDPTSGFVRVVTPNGITDSAGREITGYAPIRTASDVTMAEKTTHPVAPGNVVQENASNVVAALPPAPYVPPVPPPQPTHAPGTEFGHAINFVNKIKQRFSDQPDVYKQFLEILQQYQKEGKPLQEVYAQVQVLFQDAPDLLAEFKQFLPEPGSQVPPPTSVMPARTVSRGGSMGQHGRMPTMGGFNEEHPGRIGFGPGPSSGIQLGGAAVGRKKRIAAGEPAKTKRSKLAHQVAPQPSTSGHHAQQAAERVKEHRAKSPSPATKTQLSTTDAELMFFESCKKHIGSKPVYNEFLKLLNLFSQEIISVSQLVARAEPFIGSDRSLYDQFKKFLGFEKFADEIVDNIPASVLAAGASSEDRPRVDLEKCRKYGPSYRLLPSSEQNLPSHGRDSIANQVLNDQYASHPTLESENTGFLAHRKNPNEEQLFRCEEERYDYDHNIQMVWNVIRLLETRQQEMLGMTPEESSRLVLDDTLGGRSRVIWRLAVQKIYGDQAPAVCEQLMQNPVNAVPIVLRRLKQKEEEWRKSKREANRIWREVEARNYYKALDHRGVSFKANEKRALSAKTFVSEIEAIQRERPRALVGDLSASERDHLVYAFSDVVVHSDVRRLIESYCHRQLPTVQDRNTVMKVVDGFLSEFFSVDYSDSPAENATSRVSDVDVDMNEQERSIAKAETWLRATPSHVAKAEGVENNGHVAPGSIRGNVEDGFVSTAVGPLKSSNVLFGDGSFYVLFRLYQVLYSRVLHLKLAATQAKENALRNPNPIAKDLALRFNLPVFRDYNLEQDDFYEIFLQLTERLFNNRNDDFDMMTYEEALRMLFGIEAYVMYTVDRLMQVLVKQIQAVCQDELSKNLLQLYEKSGVRVAEKMGLLRFREQIRYRVDAETIIANQDRLYRMEYIPEDTILRIQLLTAATPSSILGLEEVVTQEERWSRYIENFCRLEPTLELTNLPFLRRNLSRITTRDPSDTIIFSHMEVKICVNTYRMFFMEGGWDLIARNRRGLSKATWTKSANKRYDKWIKRLGKSTAAGSEACDAWFKGAHGLSSVATEESRGKSRWKRYTTLQDAEMT